VSRNAGFLGEGSPLSGEEHTLPAVVAESMLTHHFTELNTHANPGNGVTRTTGFGTAGETAPSANSGISPWFDDFSPLVTCDWPCRGSLARSQPVIEQTGE
jgi:hypothetical protein